MEVAGKKVLIIGAARSGIACAGFLAARGARVALHDRKPLAEWEPDAVALKSERVGLVPGEVPGWLLDQMDLVVVSPGVPSKSIPLRYAERAGVEVIGEIEFAARFLQGRIIGITGSNGKTTTTSLTGELLRNAGITVQVGGNIGQPLISLVETSQPDGWSVVELSSFQLDTIKDFHPQVAVVLNVTPNHMDRYESFTEYAAAKHRIFMNQGPGDLAVLNAADPLVSSWANGLRASVVSFNVMGELQEGVFLRGTEIVSRTRDAERTLLTRADMKLRGLHNVENVLAAICVGLACGVNLESMRETIRNFRPVEHRLEFVSEIGGVKFYNDSKATSVDATLKAVEAFDDEQGQIILILGGRGKKAPYSPLAHLVEKRVRQLVLIGEDAGAIASQLGTVAPVQNANSMGEAVQNAFKAAGPGDIVLLAPACASFDMFKDFEERGRVFKDEVRKLQS